MKEYKFRAWDSLAEKMYSWTELLNQNLKNIFTIPEQCGYHLMQYTGLKDKNGKEIYEGDIVKFKDRITNEEDIFTIKYCEERASFVLSNKSYNEMTINVKDRILLVEVIGNIYDNKNLLEEGE